MQPDRVSLKRFNYSPGEDDSEWLNSLEKVEEDDMQRRGGGGQLATSWRESGNDWGTEMVWMVFEQKKKSLNCKICSSESTEYMKQQLT